MPQEPSSAAQPTPQSPTLRVPPLTPQGDQLAPTATLDQIYAAGGIQQQGQPEPAQAAPTDVQTQRAQRHLDRIERIQKRLDDLEDNPAKDKNGRWKSALKMALVGALGALAQTGDWRAGLGGLAGGFGAGLVNPAFDEETEQAQQLARWRARLDEALKSGQATGRIDAAAARRLTIMGRQQTSQNDPKARAQAMRELQQRMKLTGDRFDSNDQRSVELAQQLNISPRGKGRGFNYQSLKVVDGALVHVENIDGRPTPVVIFKAGMSDGEKVRNAIALAQVNANRRRNGEAPLEIDESALASLPADQSTSEAQGTAQPPASNQAAPGGQQPRPILREVPGATVPPVQRRGRYTGRGAAGAAPRGGSNSIGESITNNRMLDVIPSFEAAKRRGQRDEAIGILNETLNNPNTRGQYEGGLDADGNPWLRRKGSTLQRAPKGTINARVGPRSHASIDRRSEGAQQIITRSSLKEYAAAANISEADAEEEARAKGISIEEDDQR